MKFNPMSLQNNFHNFYESKNQASNQKPKKKKRKKQSSKHLHSFHPLPLFLSNKTVQIDTHPTPSYNTERVGMRGW